MLLYNKNRDILPIFIAMGGNLPFAGRAPEVTIGEAMTALGAAGLPVLMQSRLFRTPCFPVGAGPDYINGVAVLDGGDLTANQILAKLHSVEAMFGRARQQRWGGRTLDLDLLAIADSIMPDLATFASWHDLPAAEQILRAPSELILPHPRLHQRAFVLIPFEDVAPVWVHPVLKKSVRQMCAGLAQSDRDAVIALDA
jgi:2-amino-4-hydroxy-6-hydroxymethyldihydropteridine diphosphokinase